MGSNVFNMYACVGAISAISTSRYYYLYIQVGTYACSKVAPLEICTKGCRTHQLLIPPCIGGMTAKYLRCAGPWGDTSWATR